jgi:hypothetical protein
MDVDHTRALTQELMESRFKAGIPSQDRHGQTVDRIQAHILLRMTAGKPPRARILRSAIDHVRDVVLGCKALR